MRFNEQLSQRKKNKNIKFLAGYFEDKTVTEEKASKSKYLDIAIYRTRVT